MRAVRTVLPILCLILGSPALAQNPYSPAVTVNDSVITRYDIEQRIAFLQALGAPGNLDTLAVEQLTEDRLKVQAAEALEIELPEGAVSAGIEEFATARGLTTEQVLEVLSQRGIDQQTMTDFVEAGLLWRDVVIARFRARATPTEGDLDTALDLSATVPREVLTLGEIALPFAERGEAATLELADRLVRELTRGASFSTLARQHSRSGSVAQGGVLPPVAAAALPPAIRSQVLILSPGGVTRPIPIGGGVAIIKLISVRQEAPGAGTDEPEVDRNALREQLFTERITSFGQGYLQELLGDALIVTR